MRLAVALVAVGVGVAACSPPTVGPVATASSAKTIRCLNGEKKRALDAALEAGKPRYAASIIRARAWLDALVVDPMDLRLHRIKGKKKLVEALDAYYRLSQITPPEDRAALVERVQNFVAVTSEDRYHDMLTLDDLEFKEDATSYLRAAFLMDKLGLDTTRYRQQIAACKWRMDAHLKSRGPHQKRAFHAYYLHFGMAEPFPLEGALDKGLIAKRADPDKLTKADVYALTHEVFAVYDYGDRLDADDFTDADRVYLRDALAKSTEASLRHKDPDLMAELVACMRLLRFVDVPEYAQGIAYLLGAQNADGSWGSYPREEKRLYAYVKQGFYLHTTMVVIDALALAFDPRFRSGEGPVCGG